MRALSEGLTSGIGCSSIMIFLLGLFSFSGCLTLTYSIWSIGSAGVSITDSYSESSVGLVRLESSYKSNRTTLCLTWKNSSSCSTNSIVVTNRFSPSSSMFSSSNFIFFSLTWCSPWGFRMPCLGLPLGDPTSFSAYFLKRHMCLNSSSIHEGSLARLVFSASILVPALSMTALIVMDIRSQISLVLATGSYFSPSWSCKCCSMMSLIYSSC